MRVKDITIYPEKIKAIVKINLIKFEKLEIPTKHLMLIFTDPEKWDELTDEIITEHFDGFSDEVKHMYHRDNKTLAELLLKIAGKHPHPYENEYFKEMLANPNKAVRNRLRNI
jgi:hypothetical protein